MKKIFLIMVFCAMFFSILIVFVPGHKYTPDGYQGDFRAKWLEVSDYVVSLQENVEDNLSEHKIFGGSHEEPLVQVPDYVYDMVRSDATDQFHYEHLTEPEKEVYAEILWAITSYKSNVQVSTTDNETVSKCFQCVLNDHPEIFYIKGYRYTNFYSDDTVDRIGISGTYTMSQEDARQYQNRIDACIDQIMKEIPESQDEYIKTKYIYEYIVRQTEYDGGAENNQNIISVFLNKKSVCQGYTKAMQLLLEKAGIKATTILGYVKAGNHAWNLVSVNGNWYYLDATWGDSEYYRSVADDACGAGMENVNYDYLLVTSEFLGMTHVTDNVVDPPPCISVRDNYYVQEGLYFEDINTEDIKAVFDRSYAAGQELVTLRCASPVVYEQMKTYLISEQGVFQYLHRDNDMISYIDNTSHNSLSFWL